MNEQNLQVPQTQSESETSDDYPAGRKEESLLEKIKLKLFIDEHFRGTSLEEWYSWEWQIKNGITDAEHLVELLGKKKNDIIFNMTKNHLPFRITPYVLYLLDCLPTDHPLYKTIIPTVSAEVIGDIIVGSVTSTLVTTPSSQNVDIVAEALAKKNRKEFIESEKRRLWHLGIGKGHHLE